MVTWSLVEASSKEDRHESEYVSLHDEDQGMIALPAVAKILVVFVGMLVISRVRVRMGLAIILGSIVLNLWAGQAPEEILASLGSGLKQPYLWILVTVTALVVGLGRYMSEERNSAAIISVAQRLGGRHGRAWSLMAVPAVIGLVPMPAGALFSAPIVQQTVCEDHWASDWKVAVNYWFRHVWEYWWPIYPGVIVALAVFQMETWQYILSLIAFTPVTLAAGYWFLLRPQGSLLQASQQEPVDSQRRLAVVMLPLGVIVACALFMSPVLARLVPGLDLQTRKLSAMLIGMVAALGIILRDQREQGITSLFASMVTPNALNILLTVGSIILFQHMLKSSGLLPTASRELLESGIPLLLVVALLPMLAGMITGLAIGFTGIAFPLVVGLMNVEGSPLTPMATLVLAFGSGYMAMMMSPVHLCLLASRDFFSASLLTVYRRIIPCVCTILVFTLVLFGIFHAFGW